MKTWLRSKWKEWRSTWDEGTALKERNARIREENRDAASKQRRLHKGKPM